MEHVKALTIKFVMITAMLAIVLGLFYGVGFGDIVAIGLILTIAAYLIGDLLTLPALGNVSATLADFGLAFFGTWILGALFIEARIPLISASFISAIAIAVGEVFFHRYMKDHVLDDKRQKDRRLVQDKNLATEFAEEHEGHDIRKDDNREE
ncbi:YndM family protein [Aquibacillus sp. 3ASR75-11]|uniref:YndM family protein n=1 Tax=Terrihalobacillus insolitus TaxID=2950438 RepID=A0A9X3WR12_9BACI|nr:YndM family protein [Terrihalobacillus insolitus]MDC3423283.1 YndM family protein [Terrihalobacillus insolitus]